MKTAEIERYLMDYSRISSGNKIKFEKLRAVLSQMQKEGIDCILLKGADVIPRLYGVRGLRPMVDVDLLVHEQDLPAIDSILTGLGFRPQLDGNPVYVDPDDVLSLDIITEIWYLDNTDVIWQRANERTLQGVPVKGMGATDLLLYLTMYVVVHRGCVSPVFAQDLALLIDAEAIDWPFILTEATRHNFKVPLYHGLAYAMARSDARIPQEILGRLAPAGLAERCLRLLLHKLVTERGIPEIGFFLLLITRPGFQKLRWLTTSLFPPTAFLGYRYGARAAARPFGIRVLRPVLLVCRGFLLSARIVSALFKPPRPKIIGAHE